MAPQLLPDLGGLRLCPTGVDYSAEDIAKADTKLAEWKTQMNALRNRFWNAVVANNHGDLLQVYTEIRNWLDIDLIAHYSSLPVALLAERDNSNYFKEDFPTRLQHALTFSRDGVTPAAMALQSGHLDMAMFLRHLVGSSWALAGKPIKDALEKYTEDTKDAAWRKDTASIEYSTWLQMTNLIQRAKRMEDAYYTQFPAQAPAWWKHYTAHPEQAPAWWNPVVKQEESPPDMPSGTLVKEEFF